MLNILKNWDAEHSQKLGCWT